MNAPQVPQIEGFHDLHLHVIPGLDDGSRSLQASIEMLQGLNEEGFSHFVATPHADDRRWTYGKDAIDEGFQGLKEAVASAGLDIDLRCGAEYTYGTRFHRHLQERRLMTLAGSRYVLMELPEAFMPATMPETLFAIGVAGYYPVLAHPERCKPYHGNPEKLSQLANGRGLVQVSFRSLAGTFGRTIKKTAWSLIETGVADLVATDCHHPGELQKVVRPVMKALRKRMGPDELHNLMSVLPARMLERPIEQSG